MTETTYVLVFWYGILHAFGPDHLTVIANFSIGKSLRKSFIITLMFALGHGLSLFIFATLLQSFPGLEQFTIYGDIIASSLLMAMGFYLLFMALSGRIQLTTHTHHQQQHRHISFGKHHHQSSSPSRSVWIMGALMGLGGVKNMLFILGLAHDKALDWSMIGVFIVGVSVVFVVFGLFIFLLNRHVLTHIRSIRRTFLCLGLLSIGVGFEMLWL